MPTAFIIDGNALSLSEREKLFTKIKNLSFLPFDGNVPQNCLVAIWDKDISINDFRKDLDIPTACNIKEFTSL